MERVLNLICLTYPSSQEPIEYVWRICFSCWLKIKRHKMRVAGPSCDAPECLTKLSPQRVGSGSEKHAVHKEKPPTPLFVHLLRRRCCRSCRDFSICARLFTSSRAHMRCLPVFLFWSSSLVSVGGSRILLSSQREGCFFWSLNAKTRSKNSLRLIGWMCEISGPLPL